MKRTAQVVYWTMMVLAGVSLCVVFVKWGSEPAMLTFLVSQMAFIAGMVSGDTR